jgi:hypothetical protein
MESSRAPPPHRPREDGLADPAGTSRSNLAAALGLLSRWRLSKPKRMARVGQCGVRRTGSSGLTTSVRWVGQGGVRRTGSSGLTTSVRWVGQGGVRRTGSSGLTTSMRCVALAGTRTPTSPVMTRSQKEEWK